MPAYRSRCMRCGQTWVWFGQRCGHPETCRTTDIDNDEAERIQARYAFGRLHNPDHDTTSYRDVKENA